jgi:transposase-like protein
VLQRAEVTPKPERIKAAAEFLESGKTMTAWSEEHQINRFTLHNWVKEYRRHTETRTESCKWVEIDLTTRTADVKAEKEITLIPEKALYTPIRISIGDTNIEVTSGFDETALSAVIKAVTFKC